jgi:hypothetical protein
VFGAAFPKKWFMDKEQKQKNRRISEAIDHARFPEILSREFPEVPQAFDKYTKGLLHCEMGMLAALTEEAMDQGRFWQAEKYFNFMETMRAHAVPEVTNAIDVSYIEYLALSEVTDNRHQALRRMPKVIRAILLDIDGRGRWA